MQLNISDFVERLKNQYPLKEFEKIGFSQNTINNWKFRNSFPKSDDLYKISTFLNVSMEYLLTGEDKDNNLSQNETKLLANFRKLSDDRKKDIQIMISALASSPD